MLQNLKDKTYFIGIEHVRGEGRALLLSKRFRWVCETRCASNPIEKWGYSCSQRTHPWREPSATYDEVWSMMTSVIGRVKSSLGHAAWRSRKSTQTRICPFFFLSGTGNPVGIFFFSDESGIHKLTGLGSDLFPQLDSHSSGSLFHCFSVW